MALNPRRPRILKAAACLVVAYAAISFLVLALGSIDYARVAKGEEPLFTFDRAGVADGGSVEYRGLGYVLYSTHRYSTSPKPAGTYVDGWAYDVGPAIYYPIKVLWPWGPAVMRDREDLRLVTREEDEALWATRRKIGAEREQPPRR